MSDNQAQKPLKLVNLLREQGMGEAEAKALAWQILRFLEQM